MQLALGRALRTRSCAPGADGAGVTALEFHVPVPATDRLLLLTFSTPMPVPELVEAFVELFDAIAEGARWVR